MTNRVEKGRFKYAEEFAKDLDDEGFIWRMFRAPDESYVEDGETYTRPVYVVEWEDE